MKVLITGASGFVGKALCRRISLEYPQFSQVYAFLRDSALVQTLNLPPRVTPVVAHSLTELTNMPGVFDQVDCVIHLAARVHQMNDQSIDPLAEFRAVNTIATLELAQAAAKAGVRRFIYLSSVKVHGEETRGGYSEADQPSPQDPYGVSKAEAEDQLYQLARETGLEVVILRPPLVYGPGVKANFFQMMRMIHRGVPLPIGAIRNSRSLVYVENLADAIITASIHPKAANQTFLVSDREDVSTPQLARKLAQSFGRSARLIPVPVVIFRYLGKLTGKSSAVSRLTGSLTVDSQKIAQFLDWQPPYTLNQGLKATTLWFESALPPSQTKVKRFAKNAKI